MSRPNQHTWQKYRVGQVLITVQLDPLAEVGNSEPHQELARRTRDLIERMESHRLPVTWAVNDPAHSAATPYILRSAVQHELAILGDTNWLGPTAGRTRFARELARRVSQARAAGIEIKTLVPRVATVKRHIDLVVKHEITAIAGVPATDVTCQSSCPHALHYGLWEMPESGRLPVRGSWWTTGKRGLLRQIRRAGAAASMYHLVIDAPSLLEDGPRAKKTADWLMQRIADMRNRGLVDVETLGAAAARLSAVRSPSPQQSILRRAA
jgi:hypothetical protein